MFKEFEIDYNWSPEYYDELQNMIGGGIPKMRYYFNEYGWPTSKLGAPPTVKDAQEKMLNTLQDRKTEIYKEIIRTGGAEVRERESVFRHRYIWWWWWWSVMVVVLYSLVLTTMYILVWVIITTPQLLY